MPFPPPPPFNSNKAPIKYEIKTLDSLHSVFSGGGGERKGLGGAGSKRGYRGILEQGGRGIRGKLLYYLVL